MRLYLFAEGISPLEWRLYGVRPLYLNEFLLVALVHLLAGNESGTGFRRGHSTTA